MTNRSIENLIATEILSQLGGNKFVAMTGAKNFSSGMFKSGPGLSMRLPRTPKGRFTGLRIELTAGDDYKVSFLKQAGCFARGNFRIEEKTIEGVYADNLRQIFTSETGLETSL